MTKFREPFVPCVLYLLLTVLFSQTLSAQTSQPEKKAIRAARMVDGKSDTTVSNPFILKDFCRRCGLDYSRRCNSN